MSSVPQGEGYTGYSPHVSCSKWFCWRKPVFRKLIIKFPVIPEYVPRCEKHK